MIRIQPERYHQLLNMRNIWRKVWYYYAQFILHLLFTVSYRQCLFALWKNDCRVTNRDGHGTGGVGGTVVGIILSFVFCFAVLGVTAGIRPPKPRAAVYNSVFFYAGFVCCIALAYTSGSDSADLRCLQDQVPRLEHVHQSDLSTILQPGKTMDISIDDPTVIRSNFDNHWNVAVLNESVPIVYCYKSVVPNPPLWVTTSNQTWQDTVSILFTTSELFAGRARQNVTFLYQSDRERHEQALSNRATLMYYVFISVTGFIAVMFTLVECLLGRSWYLEPDERLGLVVRDNSAAL